MHVPSWFARAHPGPISLLVVRTAGKGRMKKADRARGPGLGSVRLESQSPGTWSREGAFGL